jgi:hypothetical protein
VKKIHDFLIDNAVSVALCMFVVVLAFYLYHFHTQVISEDVTKWGVFGDFIGGTLNPFLSFLALVILLRTFAMQKTELDLQREELKDTKELLRLQTQTQIKQRFESTFFELLNVHNQILSEITKEPIPIKTDSADKKNLGETGAKIFDSVNKKWDKITNKSILNKMIFEINYFYDSDECEHKEIQSLEMAYNNLKEYALYQVNYFHALFSLLQFVSKLNSEDDEIFYANIIKSVLNDPVFRLLAIYAYKNEEYKRLIERYSIFEMASFNKNIADDEFSAVSEAVEFYDKRAFGL